VLKKSEVLDAVDRFCGIGIYKGSDYYNGWNAACIRIKKEINELPEDLGGSCAIAPDEGSRRGRVVEKLREVLDSQEFKSDPLVFDALQLIENLSQPWQEWHDTCKKDADSHHRRMLHDLDHHTDPFYAKGARDACRDICEKLEFVMGCRE